MKKYTIVLTKKEADFIIEKFKEEILEIDWQIRYAKNNFFNFPHKMKECEVATMDNEIRKSIIEKINKE